MIKSAIAKWSLNLQWWLIVIILFFSTIAFGGVGPRAIYITRLLILFGFLLQLVIFFSEDNYLKDLHPAICFPILAFVAFLALVDLQYLFGLKILKDSNIGSVNPYLTYDSLIQSMIYLMFFMACLKIAAKQQLVERLASSIVAFTFIIAILGLAQDLVTGEKILWKAASSIEGSSFGPFIDPNHFGGFLALTFPLALGLMHYRFNKIKREFASDYLPPSSPPPALAGGGLRWGGWLALINEGVVFLFFLVILTLVACFFSVARVSLFVLLFSLVAYFVAYGIKERNARFYLILPLVLASSFLLIWWLGKGHFTGHFGTEHLKKAWDLRFDVARQSLDLLHEYPFFGTGLGTYGLISSKVVSRITNEVWWNHAHNDYVELMTDTGIVGFCLFMGAILVLLFLCFRQMRKNSSHWNKAVATQGFISIFCIGAMEFSEFHLRTPSIALFFTLQLALLFQSSYAEESHDGTIPSRHSRESGNLDPSPKVFIGDLAPRLKRSGATKSVDSGMTTASDLRMTMLKGTAVLIGLVLLISIIPFSTNDYRASMLAETNGDGRLESLQKAVTLQPSYAKLWYLLGKEYEINADKLDTKDGNALKLKREAVVALRKAVALSPSYDTYWYDLGILEYETGYEKEGILSLEKAVYWSPVVLRYSVYLLGVYLRESERTRSREEKIEFLRKAKDLYFKLQKLEVKPRMGHYETWIGEYYHKKLQQLIPSWRS